ncbi:MAG: hypothetical protein H6901_11230 [Rhodobacteraceae bacterium]|nr:hypothetical protein [Paracoccaceae bacterium]MCP5342777.1 hypothetical protein [Paracoccaceae bacterium]
MKSRLITVFAVVAIAFNGLSASSALADSKRDKQVLTLLLGAATLGLILNEAKKKDRRDTGPVWRDDHSHHPYFLRDQDKDRRHNWRRDHRDGQDRLLPSICAYDLKSYNGRSKVVSRQCLADYGMHRGLPRECAFEAKGKHGWGVVYGARCLRENGYRIADLQF